MFTKLASTLLLGASVCLATSFLHADEAGQDHPLLPHLPGFTIYKYYVHDYDVFDETLSRTGKPDLKFHAEGKVTYIQYTRSQEISAAEVVANYVTALKAIGGVEMNSDNGVNGDRVVKVTRPSGDIYVAIGVESNRAHYYSLRFIEVQPRRQLIAANGLYDAINKDGFVALYINFDTNKSDVPADGQPVIEQIATLLKSNPKLNVSIDGHTDNVGSAASNKALSLARAQSVMQAVVAQGIAPTRLNAQGFGQEVPIADNRTPDGRALNRRVELTKRP